MERWQHSALTAPPCPVQFSNTEKNSTKRKYYGQSDHGLRYLANCSMLFTEHPLLERPHAARAAGFDAIEFWWPWPDQPVPSDAEVTGFVSAVARRRGPARRPELLRRRPRRSRLRRAVDPATGRRSSATTSTSPSASASSSGSRHSTPSTATGSRAIAAEDQDELAREQLGLAAGAAAGGSARPSWSSRSAGPSPTRCAPPRTAWPWWSRSVRDGGHQHRLPVRPVPPGQQRRRPGRGHRDLRRRDRARADRRLPRPGRARHGRASTSTGCSATSPSAVTTAGSAWSTSRPPTTEASLSWLPEAR